MTWFKKSVLLVWVVQALTTNYVTANTIKINLAADDVELWKRDAGVPRPILRSFAEHLKSAADLFSAIVGTRPTPAAVSLVNDAPVKAVCEAPGTGTDLPDWSGPYCLIAYDEEISCQETFNCHFDVVDSSLPPGGGKLCCRPTSEAIDDTFGQVTTATRVFFQLQELAPVAECTSIHFNEKYSLVECIMNPKPKPERPLFINKFDVGEACKLWGEKYGYYSIDPIPRLDYKTQRTDWVGKMHLQVCAMHRNYDTSEETALTEAGSIMPFCTFKLAGQECPSYAPLHLTFPRKDNVSRLPQDALYESITFLDTSGFCCSLTNHLTVDKTIVNLDYLPRNWTMNDFQVIRWPYAACPEFEFPKMKLTVFDVEYSGANEYPYEDADMMFSICHYTKTNAVPTTTSTIPVTVAKESLFTSPVVSKPTPSSAVPLKPTQSIPSSVDHDGGVDISDAGSGEDQENGADDGVEDGMQIVNGKIDEKLTDDVGSGAHMPKSIPKKVKGIQIDILEDEKSTMANFPSTNDDTGGSLTTTTTVSEEEAYQQSLIPQLESLHHKYANQTSKDKYAVNPFNTSSDTTKLFRNRRAGCYFSTNEAFCRGDWSPFVEGLQICCDETTVDLQLNELWDEPYPSDFFTIRGHADEPCRPVSSEGNETIIRQAVRFEYELKILQLDACIYTIISEEDMLNSPNEPSEEPITMLTQPVDLTPKEEIRPLFGYLKTADTRCLSATSTVFTITQDTEDHPTDIANCSESWARTLVPNTASSTIRGQRYCSSESHGLVTWQMCMGEFPELKGQMDTAKFTTDAENEKNATHGYCIVKAAIVICPEGYREQSVKWKNEVNGNQNNYEFQRPPGMQDGYERIWPGGYFGPGPELQIDFCCKHVTAIGQQNNTQYDGVESGGKNISYGNDVAHANPDDYSTDTGEDQDGMVNRLHDYLDPSVDDRNDYGVSDNDNFEDVSTFALVRFGKHCPLLNGYSAEDAWFDFPTEKNNDYDAIGDVAEKSEYGIKLHACIYGTFLVNS